MDSSLCRTSPSSSADEDLFSNTSSPNYSSSSSSSSSSLKSRSSSWLWMSRSFINFSSFSSSSSSYSKPTRRYLTSLLLPVSAVMLAWLIIFVSFTLTDIRDDLILNWDEYGTTASQKLTILWDRISSNREPEPYPGILELLIRGFLFQTDDTERITKSYTFRPFEGRRKVIHTQSAYSRIRWTAVPNAMNYTGLLADKEVLGYMTYSKGSKLASNVSSSWGIGLKLFRDYDLPAGHVLCNSQFVFAQLTTFQWNIFSSMPCGHVDITTGFGLMLLSRRHSFNLSKIENNTSSSIFHKMLDMKFWTLFPSMTGLSNLAVKTKTGKIVEKPNFPFVLCLRPNPQLTHQFSEQRPWFHPIEQMRNVPMGTYLYDVIVLDSPNKVLTGKQIEKYFIKIAEIYSDSEFVSSRWGDQRLSVQHQKFEEDIELRPSWKEELNLKTLTLDGIAYLPVNKAIGVPPTKEQIYFSFVPSIQGIMNALFNPGGLNQFLKNEVGFGDVPTMISNIKLNAVSPRVATRAQEMMMMTETTTAEGKRDYEKEKEKVFESVVDYFIQTFLGTKTPEEKTATTIFSSRDDDDESSFVSSNYSFSAPPFTLSLTPQQRRILSSFIKNVSPGIVFDGHFIRPMNFMGFRSLFTEPIIVAIAQAVFRQYIDTYGISFYREIIRALVTSSVNPLSLLSDVLEILNSFRIDQIEEQGEEEEMLTGQMRANKIREAFLKIEKTLHEPMIKLGELNFFASNSPFPSFS